MPPVELSNAADADLSAILDYSIEAHGRPIAEAYIAHIGEALDRLAAFPELGALRDLDPPLRCLPCREHRIFYSFDGYAVFVARVLHKAMDVERWLD